MLACAILALAAARVARAGYITVGMGEAQQCNTSVVEWYGDDGPYHLLLTPTQFISHGYNVWVPTIPNGTNSYNLSINQPAGLQYMVTVWGASGIEYAGTTDVLTVQPNPKNDNSCFLTNEAINHLYTFAFNISDSDNGRPPQCSNLSVTWPTSLESAVTVNSRRRGYTDTAIEESQKYGGEFTSPLPQFPKRQDQGIPSDEDWPNVAHVMVDGGGDDDVDTSSSNKTSGNTTLPPTLFGIIPLGNSFSIPITYPRNSKFSAGLPQSSLSDTPTTWTSKGVTHLNWTVTLAKGTRFILVAGIGSNEEWASGGSSEMLTVGQGGFGCFSPTDGAANPSITHSGSTSGLLHRPTGSGGAKQNSGGGKSNTVARTVLACVFSVLGTLAIVLCLWCCCRGRRKRKKAIKEGRPKPSFVNLATFGRLDKKVRPLHSDRNGDISSGDTEMDLIAGSRDDMSDNGRTTASPTDARVLPPISTSSSNPRADYTNSTLESPGGYRDYPHLGPGRNIYGFSGDMGTIPSQDGAYPVGYAPVSSPTSPMFAHSPTQDVPRTGSFERMGADGRHDFLGAQHGSIDGLVAYPPMAHSSPMSPSPLSSLAMAAPRRGPLVLHDGGRVEAEDDENRHDPQGEGEDISDLKRDTLAFLSPRAQSPRAEGSRPPRRRRTEGPEATYLVHRDAGRVAAGPGPSRGGRVLELPPRYEELNWDDEIDSPPATASSVQTPVGGRDPTPPLRAHTVDGSSTSLALPARSSPAPASPAPHSPPAPPAGRSSADLPSPQMPGSRPLSHADADSYRSLTPSLPPGAAPPPAPRTPRIDARDSSPPPS